jgi:hypothetical protein
MRTVMQRHRGTKNPAIVDTGFKSNEISYVLTSEKAASVAGFVKEGKAHSDAVWRLASNEVRRMGSEGFEPPIG